FLIERAYLHESYSTNLPQQSDFISDQQQEALAEQILNTFVLTSYTSEGTTKIKLYFVDKNKESMTCNEVVAVERTITKTPRIATATLNELLDGPTAAERKKGYATIIPEGSQLNSLAIANGEARADFNAITESGGGSCGMGMRTAQISETLKQFSTVKTVKFSIEGKTDGTFQP
ncbi:MAG: GerMN domain-containing protein, partial [bacterium]|nr:GerMN domain-containing protein [bacterium]